MTKTCPDCKAEVLSTSQPATIDGITTALNEAHERATAYDRTMIPTREVLAILEHVRVAALAAAPTVGRDYVLMPREATRAMTMAGCDSLPSCEHVFGHAGEMLRNAYRKMVAIVQPAMPAVGGEIRDQIAQIILMMVDEDQEACRTTADQILTLAQRAATPAVGGYATNDKALIRVTASLAAAISILERTPKSKKAVPSNKMFDQMLDDYRRSLEIGRAALAATPAVGGEGDVVTRLKELSGWKERTSYMGSTGQLIWDAINEIERLRAAATPAVGDLEAMAEIVHNARWSADSDRQTFKPFADEYSSGREYCFRIARAILAAAPGVASWRSGATPAVGGMPEAARELSLKHDWCPTCHRGWSWVQPASPLRGRMLDQANYKLGWWLAGALEDPNICAEMKDVINKWFEAHQPGAVMPKETT